VREDVPAGREALAYDETKLLLAALGRGRGPVGYAVAVDAEARGEGPAEEERETVGGDGG
jgi:hypothetical protein